MDSKDKRMLYELSENARESRNMLAKKVRVSREVLDYNIKKLQKQGIIQGFQARINISNFVYGGYILLIQSLGLNKETENNLLVKIKDKGNTQYIGRLGGGYDYIIGFTVKDLLDLSDYVAFINSAFSNKKSKMTFLTMVREFKDSFKSVFSVKDELNNLVSMPCIKEKIKTDKIDNLILEKLGSDCTIPSWKIADICKITDVAIRKRIKRLIERKIILGFRTMVDLTKLGYEPNFLFLKLNVKNKTDEEELIKYFQKNKEITYVTKLIGQYDYCITFLSKGNLELNEFIKNLRGRFKDIVSVESFHLFEMIYHTQLAKGFL